MSIETQNYNFAKKLFEKSVQHNSLISLSITVNQENLIRVVKAPGIDEQAAVILLKECIVFLEQKQKNNTIILPGE